MLDLFSIALFTVVISGIIFLDQGIFIENLTISVDGENGDAILCCVFSKEDVPVEWTRGAGSSLLTGNRFMRSSTGKVHQLRIAGVVASDAGEYTVTCNGASSSATLTLKEGNLHIYYPILPFT